MTNKNTTTAGSATAADVTESYAAITANNTFKYYYDYAKRGWLSTEAITKRRDICAKFNLTEMAAKFTELLADKSIADKYAANAATIGQRINGTEMSVDAVTELIDTVSKYTKRRATVTEETYGEDGDLYWTDKSITDAKSGKCYKLRKYNSCFMPAEYTVTDINTGDVLRAERRRKGGNINVSKNGRRTWTFEFGRSQPVNWVCGPTGWVSGINGDMPSADQCALDSSLNEYFNGPMFR